MQAEFDLHPLAVEDAQHGHQRPKIEEYGDSLFVVLHLLEPDSDGLRVGEVDVFAGPNYILTIRSHAEQGFEAVRARCEREPELLKHGSGYVLYALIDAVVDRYFPLLDALETELEGIEERIFAGTLAARERRGALRPQAEARRCSGTRSRRCSRPSTTCTARACPQYVRGHEGILPRRLRPPAAPQPDDRVASATRSRPRSPSISR